MFRRKPEGGEADVVVARVEEAQSFSTPSPPTNPYGVHASWAAKTMWMDMGKEATVLRKGDAAFRQDDEPVWIFPQVSVNAIEAINSTTQTFLARYTLFLNATITEAEFDAYHANPMTWTPRNLPYFMPYNACDVARIAPVHNPDGTLFSVTVHRGKWVIGVFYEHEGTYCSPMDVRNFPFDVQTLQIKFEIRDNHRSWTFPRSLFKIKSEPYWALDSNSAGFQNPWVPPQAEWAMSRDWIMGETLVPNADSWGPIYQVTMKVRRRWWFYIWHVILVMMIMNFAALFMYALTDLGSVLSYMASLATAAVAFLFVVSDKLPSVGYLTVVDLYLLLSFFSIVATAAVIIFLSIFTPFDAYSRLFGFWVELGVLVVGHLLFLIKGIFAFEVETSKLRMSQLAAGDAETP